MQEHISSKPAVQGPVWVRALKPPVLHSVTSVA